ncbi:MAG: hypothetical protein J1F18_10765 [Lachnospiraceae bacterium]|nr:hypothetical protein [Lachnospiraceae bacterium]
MISKDIDLDDKEHKYEISRFLTKIAIEYYVFLYLQGQVQSDEELELKFDEQLSKLIKYVRYGRKDKKAIHYDVSKHNGYTPLSRIPTEMKIKFSIESSDLIFNLLICNTEFKLNLSKANV